MDLNVLWWDLERLERDRPQDPHGLIDRVGNIRTALRQSTSIAGQTLVARLAGIDLSGILGILLDACRDIALYWGGSVLAGGAAGAGVGFFVGGVGAFPGAAIGAAAGAQAGAWVLGLLGLASLVEGLGTALGQALSCYASGIENAWGPTEWHPHRFPARAPHDFARGHEILAMALLAAIAAYLSRGRGDKQKLLQEIRQSPRLGPKVADWVAANEGRLAAHPALKPTEHLLPMASKAKRDTGPPMTPSQLRKAMGRGEEDLPPPKKPEPPPALKGMPQKRVRCFEPNDLPKSKYPEFDRQLQGQQGGLNEMTVDEYLKGREAFDPSARDPGVAKKARAKYLKETADQTFGQLRDQGMNPREARRAADKATTDKMKTMAALHNPDMYAAGKDVIADFGDRGVNSRIGAQWKTQGRIAGLDEAARSVPKTERTNTRMNASLERCK